ncbi:flagellar export chaperone FliS [Herbaspirillum sp. RTI4]|uniref:flagellar export chaperone FliS n=1 Tax=Herbaspirillum sp. RTI4 TaxID=3048640 RepID=UPI002AB52A37|nr:flagellar export chaperone FliS [Herbaspirillum sp. RTI4]MDY7578325.1 flagellar export chaperone FliS [Herbaspirillum sp. RTI4]MEA9981182.1 flagellar export chaperone FliS [Herbaspirillum sp. RTI4]
MFGSAQRGASTYAKIGIETGVVAASPHKLIIMLFEGAMTAIAMAGMHMRSMNIKDKGEAITKAILIVENGLRASLDLSESPGRDMALNLDALYDYMSRRLFEANVNNDPAILNEVHELLSGLKEAWEAIGDPVAIAAITRNQSAA